MNIVRLRFQEVPVLALVHCLVDERLFALFGALDELVVVQPVDGIEGAIHDLRVATDVEQEVSNV